MEPGVSRFIAVPYALIPHLNSRMMALFCGATPWRVRRLGVADGIGGLVKPWMGYTVLTVLTWGLWGVFSKLAANYTKPRQSILFQTVGVLAFALIVLVLEKFHVEWTTPGFTWAALGGFCAFVGFLTFFAALIDGKTSTVVVLSALYPLVTILLSVALLHERLSGKQAVGIVLALIASALLAT